MKNLGSLERASVDEIRALQLERLQWAVRHAYENVGHYRRSFDACGAHPDDLRALADMARFPFLLKQHFRDNYPFGLFAVPREKVVRLH
ncbi:MAG TPA: phenylacetate--CoA ligase, partial [Steroidobacteraceae bacterium]|nr:phenylacetate--CoA ligase [Steroidobacteraceae bacterium]